MEETLITVADLAIGFLFGVLFNHHFGKGYRTNGEMERDTGSISRGKSRTGKGNPRENDNER